MRPRDIVLFTACALVLMTGFFISDRSLSAVGPKVTVSQFSGKALIVRDGKEIPAFEGMEILAGDVVKTEKDSSIDVVCSKKWGFRLLDSSEGVLIQNDENDVEVELKQGDIVSRVEKPERDNKYRIQTPVAVLGVRGTKFLAGLKTIENNVKIIRCAVGDGTVAALIKKTGGEFPVTRGKALDARQDRDDPDLRPATDEELKTVQQADQIKVSGVQQKWNKLDKLQGFGAETRGGPRTREMVKPDDSSSSSEDSWDSGHEESGAFYAG